MCHSLKVDDEVDFLKLIEHIFLDNGFEELKTTIKPKPLEFLT